MVAVRLESVTASYGQGGAPRLKNVDVDVNEGELCALLGPNGAGKSTLVRVIAGMVAPDAGSIELFGQSAASMSSTERAQKVAVVPQRGEVALGFSVRDVVAMGRAPHQGALMRETLADREATADAIARCRLEPLADRPVAELSGGEQKRVHIARALAQTTPILLLDEAAAHLDIRHAAELYALVRREVEARNLACLLTTHDLHAAAQHADRVILLREGRVVADGAVADVMTSELLEQTFGVALEVDANHRYFLAITDS